MKKKKMITIDELFKKAWCSEVADRVIDISPTTMTPRQKSEIHFFMNEVERHLLGREEEALEYLTTYWCFYSEANPAWLAIAEREVQTYSTHLIDEIDASHEQCLRSFTALAQCLRSKTPESSRLAFQVLAYDKKLGRMVRV